MKILKYILLFLPILLVAQNGDNSPAKAFFTAYGAGASATGGRGGVLYIVTSLERNATKQGPFTNAQGETYYTGGIVDGLQHSGAAYIVFNVSGNIELNRSGGNNTEFGWTGMTGVNNKTVFGQSAPYGGITFWGGDFSFSGRNGDNQNLIFRYIRSRPLYARNGMGPDQAMTFDFGDAYAAGGVGDDAWTWALHFRAGGDSIIVDHCSFSFAWDKNIGANAQVSPARRSDNITWQYNLVSDGSTNAFDRAGNSSGAALYDEHYYVRNMMVGAHRTPNIGYNGFGEVSNNVLFDVRYRYSNLQWTLNLNHRANYHFGINTGDNSSMANKVQSGTPSIYTRENIYDGTPVGYINLTGDAGENNAVQDLWNVFGTGASLPGGYFTGTAHTSDYTTNLVTANTAFNDIVTDGNVGAYEYLDDSGDPATYRDSYDTGLITLARNNDKSYTPKVVANWVLPSIPSNSRPAGYDTDFDGMADTWEITEYGDLDEGYSGDFDADGYTNIEEYMNQVDDTTGPQPPPNPTPSPPVLLNQGKTGNTILISH